MENSINSLKGFFEIEMKDGGDEKHSLCEFKHQKYAKVSFNKIVFQEFLDGSIEALRVSYLYQSMLFQICMM